MLNEKSATNIAVDLLVVKICNPNYRFDQFEYEIYSNENKVFRKGSFRAPVVQLRTLELDEGTWHIRLKRFGQEWKTRDFEKQSDFTIEKTKKANTIYFL